MAMQTYLERLEIVNNMVAEKELYEAIKRNLCDLFQTKFDSHYLAITSEGIFPEEILSHVQQHDEIIFSFLKKKNSPDLTGVVELVTKTEPKYATFQFVTVEIKNATIGLEDVYQAKRYADLFKAKYGFLISTRPIPTAIKRLCERIPILCIAGTAYERLRLAQFDAEKGQIIQTSWFPESPFK
jgi:hypothetical protein